MSHLLGDVNKMDCYGVPPSVSRNYYIENMKEIKLKARAYARCVKKENPWKYLLLTGAGHMFLGTRIGGLASWYVCAKWRIKREDPRLCFDILSMSDKVQFIKEVYQMAEEFPKDWNGYWVTFLMLFDKYVMKDWNEE